MNTIQCSNEKLIQDFVIVKQDVKHLKEVKSPKEIAGINIADIKDKIGKVTKKLKYIEEILVNLDQEYESLNKKKNRTNFTICHHCERNVIVTVS